MIQMIVNFCTCCDQPADICNFQRTLKDLRAERFGKPWIVEKAVPECSNSS